MRTKFKRNRLCSSDNYILSKKLHKDYLVEEHNNNVVVIEQIISSKPKRAYVRCFGQLIPITLEEANTITTTVIWL